MTPVAVVGACGRMGSAVAEAVAGDGRFELVAAVDPSGPGRSAAGVEVSPNVEAIAAAGAQVAVDFTNAAAARSNIAWYAAHGIHAVVGTTGLDEADMDAAAAAYPPGGSLGCVVAANFAIGAVLMMRFAELAAPWFETAEIIELHHDAKIDAPSGTALATAARMAAAGQLAGKEPAPVVAGDAVPAARGGTGPGGIRVHSVRLRGLVAHQEVLLGTTGQTLSIRHDTTDRSSFMPGVLLAAGSVASRPGLTVGLDALLGLA